MKHGVVTRIYFYKAVFLIFTWHEIKNCSLAGFDAVWVYKLTPTFRRTVLHPSSGLTVLRPGRPWSFTSTIPSVNICEFVKVNGTCNHSY